MDDYPEPDTAEFEWWRSSLARSLATDEAWEDIDY